MELFGRFVRFTIQTVAANDGPAVGAGATLALASDVHLSRDRVVVGFVVRQVGLSLDAGTSYLLPRVVGENVAKELALTDDIFGADRAEKISFANHVYPEDVFDEEVDAFPEKIVSEPSIAHRHANRLNGDGLEMSFEQVLADEACTQGIVFDTDDHEEGARAFLRDR